MLIGLLDVRCFELRSKVTEDFFVHPLLDSVVLLVTGPHVEKDVKPDAGLQRKEEDSEEAKTPEQGARQTQGVFDDGLENIVYF